MRHLSLRVISVPDQGSPRNVPFVVEFIKVLEKESSVLTSEVYYTQATFFLWPSALPPSH
jgi:hypothetical protein